MREKFLDRIRSNIDKSGRHITVVSGGESPRFVYTIGVTKSIGRELILAGFVPMPNKAVARLLNHIAGELEAGVEPFSLKVEFEEFGGFQLAPVHRSWNSRTVLGVFDIFGLAEVEVLQVLPEMTRRTIDVPDMSKPFGPEEHRVWKWLDGGWPYSVGPESVAITNLDALQGYGISELVRWEPQEWEMFSGPAPELTKDELFPVPLATLLAYDPSLEAALDLEIGAGLYREFAESGRAGDWQAWTKKN